VTGADAPSPWAEALLAAQLFAIDPHGLGGVAVRAAAGPARERWLALLHAALPAGTPVRRVPLHITDSRLLGGLDLAATLKAGRPIAERGLLATTDGGVLELAMAERLAPATAARLAHVLDRGEVDLQRDGLTLRLPARFGVIALDEGLTEEEVPPAALLDRLAFRIDLSAVSRGDLDHPALPAHALAAARERCGAVAIGDDAIAALCEAAHALGIASLRAPLLAVRAARAAAALAGRTEVAADDLVLAGRLVLAKRATRLPAAPEPPPDAQPPPPPPGEGEAPQDSPEAIDPAMADIVLAAAAAALPPGLLARLREGGGAHRVRSAAAGRAGALRQSLGRGRPAGLRQGEPKPGARLNVVETLRAAAPWQPLRRANAPDGAALRRIEVRRSDFRVTRYKQRSETTTIFVVDASGSTAVHRLAEAKGAIELLLAECYVRRDRVALFAFRGRGAELLLPPTRSLTRARRQLAALPGGGGTPLAAGLAAAGALAEAVQRRGGTAVTIVLTDGSANVALDGTPDRGRAEADALAAARQWRGCGICSVLVDTSPRPRPEARRIAGEMGATYIALPHADATRLSAAVRAEVKLTQAEGARR
jgi:magnesium chelatase subunit D